MRDLTHYPRSPIEKIKDKWYFYDEIWVDMYGPYDTEEEARLALRHYATYLDGGLDEQQHEKVD